VFDLTFCNTRVIVKQIKKNQTFTQKNQNTITNSNFIEIPQVDLKTKRSVGRSDTETGKNALFFF